LVILLSMKAQLRVRNFLLFNLPTPIIKHVSKIVPIPIPLQRMNERIDPPDPIQRRQPLIQRPLAPPSPLHIDDHISQPWKPPPRPVPPPLPLLGIQPVTAHRQGTPTRPPQQIRPTPEKPARIKLRHAIPQVPIPLPLRHEDPCRVRAEGLGPKDLIPTLLRLRRTRSEMPRAPRTPLRPWHLRRIMACQIPA
jgi:hypothetical protein